MSKNKTLFDYLELLFIQKNDMIYLPMTNTGIVCMYIFFTRKMLYKNM